MPKLRLLLIVFLAGFVFSPATPASAADGRRVLAVVSILPLAEFAEAVGGEHVDVEVMLPPGANPAVYEPLPRQLKAVADADLYIEIGEGFIFDRVWLPRLRDLNADMDICHSSVGITMREMAVADGAHGDHDHGGTDPHVWLSPRNAQQIVENIRDCFSRIDPAHRSTYEANAKAYGEELTKLDQQLRQMLSGLNNRTFMVFHPAWGYFADEYGLTQLPVEVEGKEPSPRQMRDLIDQASRLGIRVMFVSVQFSQQSARAIAEQIGGSVAFLDPLAKDYIDNLLNVAAAFAGSSGTPAAERPPQGLWPR